MRSINRFLERKAFVIAHGAMLISVLMLLTRMSVAAAPSQAGVSWDYRLLGKLNSAQNPINGWTIMIGGSGSFDLSSSSIDGGGSYTILDAGEVLLGVAHGQLQHSIASCRWYQAAVPAKEGDLNWKHPSMEVELAL